MIEASFREAMAQAGLVTDNPIIADGRLHRFDVNGDKRGSLAGWYVLHSDGITAGAFGCWKRDIKERWCAKALRTLSANERSEYRHKMKIAKAVQEADEKARHNAATLTAAEIWRDAPLAPSSHSYLIKKNVRNHGLRLSLDNRLLVPLQDVSGKLHSIQFIDTDGEKRFLPNGRVRGCYFGIGLPQKTLCICEGYATGASIFESTGYATACTLSAGNLPVVSEILRRKYPATKIIICADDDADSPDIKEAFTSLAEGSQHLVIGLNNHSGSGIRKGWLSLNDDACLT